MERVPFTREWHIYYGLAIGLTVTEIMNCPYVLLLDLIAVHQIKTEGFERQKNASENRDEWINILQMR